LHGDLWSGNTFPDPLGRAVLVDPAVYPGDPRVDLAMTELFGGFAPAFRQAYDSVLDPGPEYDEVLRDAYQLYPLLVHVNLFGGSYVQGALDRARRILRL
jgi:fructosamine-3-kinase